MVRPAALSPPPCATNSRARGPRAVLADPNCLLGWPKVTEAARLPGRGVEPQATNLRVLKISATSRIQTDPHTSHRVPGRVSCTTGGVVRFPFAHTGARLTPRLTLASIAALASTSTRTRTRARAARHNSSLQRIVSSSTGRVLPARCNLHMLHSCHLPRVFGSPVLNHPISPRFGSLGRRVTMRQHSCHSAAPAWSAIPISDGLYIDL